MAARLHHDDYFHTSPPAGSYLATHWNVATSVYLAVGETTVPPTTEPPPSPSPSPSPMSSPTPPPSEPTTTTTTLSGALSKKRPVKTLALSVGEGDASSTLTFAPKGRVKVTSSLRLRILAADGTVLADATRAQRADVGHGAAYRHPPFEVSGTSDVTFTLQVTHVVP